MSAPATTGDGDVTVAYPLTDLSDRERGIHCTILLDRKDVPQTTLHQIVALSQREDVAHAVFMADCHPTRDSIVGLTSRWTDKCSPSLVGGDAGCGVSAYCVGVPTSKLRLEKIKDQVQARLPRGAAIFPRGEAYATEKDVHEMLHVYKSHMEQLVRSYAERFQLDLTTEARLHMGLSEDEERDYDEASDTTSAPDAKWFKARCVQLKQNYDECLCALGTLGGGNHFAEIARDSHGQIWVVVHTGSRGFGQAIYRFHSNVIHRGQDFDRMGFHKAQRKIEKQFPNKASVEHHAALEALRQEHTHNKHAPYLEGKEAITYYFDLLLAQTYAEWNRRMILRRIVTEVMGAESLDLSPDNVARNYVESRHNLIDFEDGFVRKGAIAAYTDRRSIIAINMAEGCWIGRALRDTPITNHSAPHGLGRNCARGTHTHHDGMSSRHARMSEFRKAMGDIVSDNIDESTLDESPAAYKSPAIVLASLQHHFVIEDQLRPLINIKGH